VGGGFADEKVEVTKGVGGLVLGKVAAVGGTLTWSHTRVSLDEHVSVIEADGRADGSSRKLLSAVVEGERVLGLSDLGELIAADLGVTPQGNIVGARRCGNKNGTFFGLEVLKGNLWVVLCRRMP
jgi:hypothetical protein